MTNAVCCAIACARSSAVGLFVYSVSESFSGSVSPTSPETVATLEITPGSVFVTVIVIVALAPFASVPTLQVTVPLSSEQLPVVGVAETNVVRGWRTCDIATAGAMPGPLFVTIVV